MRPFFNNLYVYNNNNITVILIFNNIILMFKGQEQAPDLVFFDDLLFLDQDVSLELNNDDSSNILPIGADNSIDAWLGEFVLEHKDLL
jgi:hypothetical protein